MQAHELFDPTLLRDLIESRIGWPNEWSIEYGKAGLPGMIQIAHQPSGALWLADHGGFLCILWDTERLFEMLEVEFDHPGALRKALTGTSYRWDDRSRQVPTARPKINLNELFGD